MELTFQIRDGFGGMFLCFGRMSKLCGGQRYLSRTKSISTAGPNLIKSNPKRPVGFFSAPPRIQTMFLVGFGQFWIRIQRQFMIKMYKIVIFWYPDVQRGRGRCPSRGAFALRFAAIEDSLRNMVKGRAWTEAEEMACMKTFKITSEDTEKGVSQKRADLMNTVFTGSSASLDWRII
jgi:hypothetical protein